MRVLILGGGNVGSLIARRLLNEGNEVTIVEISEELCAELESTLDAKIVQGSASSITTLERAGIAKADMVIAVTQSDESNILGCLIAQCHSNVKVKLLRLRTHEVDLWKSICAGNMLHIDFVIHPGRETAERILKAIDSPGISEIHDFADGRVKLFGMNVEQGSPVAGLAVKQLWKKNPKIHGTVPMIFRGNSAFIPQKTDVLRPSDHIYVTVPAESLDTALAVFGMSPRKKIERVFIVGGKQLGIELALRLEKEGVQIKLFEIDRKRCELVSRIAGRSTIVHGDGTNQQILSEEGIEGIDAYLAMSGDDEDNIIASLLARRMGARKSIALVNRPELMTMAQTLGINSVFNSRMVVVDRILQYVRKGRVLSVTTFRNQEIEAIELQATAQSKYVGKQLGLLQLPSGSTIGAITRSTGEMIVPREDVTIQEGDRVVFFCLEQLVPRLESAFTAEPQRTRP